MLNKRQRSEATQLDLAHFQAWVTWASRSCRRFLNGKTLDPDTVIHTQSRPQQRKLYHNSTHIKPWVTHNLSAWSTYIDLYYSIHPFQKRKSHKSATNFQNSSSPQGEMESYQTDMVNLKGLCI